MSVLQAVQPFILPVVAAVVGYVSYELRRYFEARRRQLRLVMALRAELYIAKVKHGEMFASEATPEIVKMLVANVTTANEGEHSMPSGAVIRGNPIFDHIRPELSDLPEEIIAPVIAYYQQAEGVAETLAAMYEGRYEGLSDSRKIAAIKAFFRIGRTTAEAADTAFAAVDAYLSGKGRKFRLTHASAAAVEDKTALRQGSHDDDGRS